MSKQSLENVEDLWPKVEGLVQTQKAMISHCISLFPQEHCASKYLTNLQFAIDAGTSGDFNSMEFFIGKVVEFVAIEHIVVIHLRWGPRGLRVRASRRTWAW